MSIANGTITIIVEYFRCWASNQVGSGSWDTGFIAIPADTHDDRRDAAIRSAVLRIPWDEGPPVLVGFYADGEIDFELGGEG